MKVDAAQLLGAQQAQFTPSTSSAGATRTGASGGGAFASGVKRAVGSLLEAGRSADVSAVNLMTGNPEDLHTAMIRMEQAEVGMRFVVQLRNRAIAAYEEVMRIQV